MDHKYGRCTLSAAFNKNDYPTCACWIRDSHSQLGVTHLVSYLLSPIQRALMKSLLNVKN